MANMQADEVLRQMALLAQQAEASAEAARAATAATGARSGDSFLDTRVLNRCPIFSGKEGD